MIMDTLGQLLINYNKKVWYEVYEKYKKLSIKLITLSFSYEKIYKINSHYLFW